MIRERFAYHTPRSVEEAAAVLADADDAACLAGGTWVVPQLTSGKRRHSAIVDLRRAGLGEIRDEDGALVVGATVTYAQLASAGQPLLATIARGITGGAQIRNQGTLAGSACYAFPSSEAPAALVALGARLRLVSAGAAREVEADAFFRDAFVTALTRDELLVEIVIPRQPEGARFGYHKLKLAQSSWPIATAACVVEGTTVRAVLGGVAARPLSIELEADADELAHRAELAVEEPWSDVLATGAYRRSVAGVVARRALAAAFAA